MAYQPGLPLLLLGAQYLVLCKSADTERPLIMPFSFPENAVLGQKTTVTCVVSSGAGPFHFAWTHDAMRVDSSRRRHVKIFSENVAALTVEAIAAEDVGNYTCTVSNAAGSASYTAALRVEATRHGNTFDVQPRATAPTTSQAIDGGVDEVGVENGAEAFRCDICLFTCPCDSELAEHMRALHADPLNRNWFKCHYCRVSFQRRDRLMVHLQKHTGTGFFDCFLCVRKFASEQNLLRHVRTVHGASENFPCQLCPRTFTRKDNLLVHIRKHRNDRC